MSRLKPRQGSYESALAEYTAGHSSVCYELLSGDDSPSSLILQSRALIRLGNPGLAVAMFDSVADIELSHELAGEMLAVKTLALVATHRFEEASSLAVDARARCYSAGIVGLEAELMLALALGAFIEGNDRSAESLAHAVLELSDKDVPAWIRDRKYRFSLNFWRSRACEILGVVEHSRANHITQAEWLRKSFDEFDKADVRDDYFEAALLANYADAAISLGLRGIADFVVERANRIEWNPSLIAFEFRVFSALAEASSIGGDQLGALRYFRRCLDCAPSAALQIRASVERARILSEIGEAFSSREELDHAVRLSKTVDWESAAPTDQRQLVFLAAQVATFSPGESQRLLSRYDGLKGNSPALVMIKDARFRGEELLARAVIMRANGNVARAIFLLIDALEIWTAAGYGSKAAFVAAELAELTNEPHYAEIARKECSQHPHSILARKMARFDAWDFQPVTSALN